MQIPNELQKKVFGYASEEAPPEGSVKAKAYELLNQGLTDEQIEKLAQTWKRMQDAAQSKIVNPIIEKQARLN